MFGCGRESSVTTGMGGQLRPECNLADLRGRQFAAKVPDFRSADASQGVPCARSKRFAPQVRGEIQ